MTTCPRCESSSSRVEHEGREAQSVVWRVYYCTACSFTWRNSELPASIDARERDPWFQIDAGGDMDFPYNIPPAGRTGR